jgi:CRP-like cAMP-binding protein
MTLDSSGTYSVETIATGEGLISRGFDGRTRDRVQNIRHFPDRRSFVNGILTGLPRSVFDKISPHLRPVDMRRDEYLYQPEDRIEYIYFPETAVFSEYQMLDDGRTIEIALMGRESVIGLTSAFSQCGAVNWTQVCIEGTVLKIESEFVRRVVGVESAVKALLNNQINSYIRHISHKVICNTHHSVEERLCTWLLMLGDRCGMELKLTQEQIARVLGVYRPSVTCIARSLRTRGLIDYVRGKLIIQNRAKLINAACSCYGEFSAVTEQFNYSQKATLM